ncbi:MAG: ethylbenzene dehydrogenase-related protein [Magnetococcus sp. DMHC-8]
MRLSIATLLAAGLLWSGPVLAKPGNADKGLAIYNKRCVWCHGEKGDGDGPAKGYLNPPPRDFTSSNYKIKTAGFNSMIPNDEDIYRMIRDGMPGTSMPGWSSVLNEQDMWDLVAQIKKFSDIKENPESQVEYGTPVASSPESLEKGKKLFMDLCAECHGDEGKGDANKKLKGDAEERTWPRNLTKPWTFRGSSDPRDIFTRVSTGIPGTQMPSFADPVSKKKMTVEERWHVANYASSLGKNGKKPESDNTVIKASRVEGELPGAPDDAIWSAQPASTFNLVPQLIGKERFFTPSNDTITVRAVYNNKEIALLLEWDDRTKSLPGDQTAISIADEPIRQDAVAVQLPVVIPEGMEKPYFGMGDVANPVNVWQWKSGDTATPESVRLLNAKGFADLAPREAAAVGLQAKGVYAKGTWKVLMKRPLTTADPQSDLQFGEGRFIPIAFATWDGSNGEDKSRHTMTTWYWLLLKPAANSQPLMLALLVVVLLGLGEFWWIRSAARR